MRTHVLSLLAVLSVKFLPGIRPRRGDTRQVRWLQPVRLSRWIYDRGSWQSSHLWREVRKEHLIIGTRPGKGVCQCLPVPARIPLIVRSGIGWDTPHAFYPVYRSLGTQRFRSSDFVLEHSMRYYVLVSSYKNHCRHCHGKVQWRRPSSRTLSPVCFERRLQPGVNPKEAGEKVWPPIPLLTGLRKLNISRTTEQALFTTLSDPRLRDTSPTPPYYHPTTPWQKLSPAAGSPASSASACRSTSRSGSPPQSAPTPSG